LTIQIRLTDPYRPPCQTRGMAPDKMTTGEVRTLMRLLGKWEREGPELVMQERRVTERQGRLHLRWPDDSARFQRSATKKNRQVGG
jgi:hypothetical protein